MGENIHSKPQKVPYLNSRTNTPYRVHGSGKANHLQIKFEASEHCPVGLQGTEVACQ